MYEKDVNALLKVLGDISVSLAIIAKNTTPTQQAGSDTSEEVVKEVKKVAAKVSKIIAPADDVSDDDDDDQVEEPAPVKKSVKASVKAIKAPAKVAKPNADDMFDDETTDDTAEGDTTPFDDIGVDLDDVRIKCKKVVEAGYDKAKLRNIIKSCGALTLAELDADGLNKLYTKLVTIEKGL